MSILAILILSVHEYGCLSIFQCLLQFLPSMFCNLHCRGLSLPGLELSLIIIIILLLGLFKGVHEWDYFPVLFLSKFIIDVQEVTNFCMLILCLTTLLNLFVSPKRLLVSYLGFLSVESYHLQTNNLTSFSVYTAFIIFSYLIAQASF